MVLVVQCRQPATPRFVTRSLLYFLYSKHCDRPMSCDEERGSVAEFMHESIVRVRCRPKFTFAISSPDELLVIKL